MDVLFSLKNNEQILLRSDSFNYELCKMKTVKDEVTGDTTDAWIPFKYFASLSAALNRLLDMKVRVSDAVTLRELAADVEAARKEITAVWSTAAQIRSSTRAEN